MGGCLHNATWSQALARCNEYGARLCTRHELQVNTNSGCGHDSELVWVWEACDHSSPHSTHVAANGGNIKEYACDMDSVLHAVRCCADDERRSTVAATVATATVTTAIAAAAVTTAITTAVAATTITSAAVAATVTATVAAAITTADPVSSQLNKELHSAWMGLRS